MSAPQYEFVLDPVACTGHGLCADVFPERITLDDWGYPMIDGTPIPPELVRLARRAADACPALALRVVVKAPTRR